MRWIMLPQVGSYDAWNSLSWPQSYWLSPIGRMAV